ncbi:hypothetical protein PR202_gb12662 [Eleusine coracana subsp. coracana]|uniref:Uncharacterized protein n=1 Tax=Eleusine coracana subsp. coracana TaxID=191504 RepID=A0AAV5EQ13_ELECO|nr:hypothetical protein PR202_gb12662 [Eleusine coracana subsp. coracana]
MTSPASTSSWFSGLTRASSSSSMAGGVASAPASASLPDAPAAAAKAVVAAAGGRRKHLPGTLFKYGPKSAQVLSRYLEPLSLALEVEKWSLVQPLLSSSYTGYGISSLEQVCVTILISIQAPVSDREYRATLPETAEMIDLAAKMIADDRGMDLMPREANPDAPITAYRYHSLCSYMGDDDMFSSDLSEDQLRQRLGHMSTTQCQIIFSMGDEYVPEYVDKAALVDRLCRALGGAEKVEIEWGNHALSNRVQEAVRAIVDFVKREGPKGWDDPWS